MGIIRNTKSVKLILAEFSNNTNAISAKQLVAKYGSIINKTTIYRVLDRLEDEGMLHSIVGVDKMKWYAKCNGCSKSQHHDVHPHFLCLDCGTVECIDYSIVIPNIPNKTILTSQILLKGKCNVCLV